MTQNNREKWIGAADEALKRLSSKARTALAAEIRNHVDCYALERWGHKGYGELDLVTKSLNAALLNFGLTIPVMNVPSAEVRTCRNEITQLVPWEDKDGSHRNWESVVMGIMARFCDEALGRKIDPAIVAGVTMSLYRTIGSLHKGYVEPR